MEVKDKSDRIRQIESAAEALFSHRGYHATSVRDIAEALNIEAASLYSHIKSKEELLWNIAIRCADEFFDSVKPIFESGLQTQVKLTDMIVAHVEVITRNLAASAVFFREWNHISEPRKTEYARLRDNYEDMFRQVVRKGIEENLFKHYDERFSSRAILSALNWTHTWYKADGDLKPHEIGEQLAEIILKGLVRTI